MLLKYNFEGNNIGVIRDGRVVRYIVAGRARLAFTCVVAPLPCVPL